MLPAGKHVFLSIFVSPESDGLAKYTATVMITVSMTEAPTFAAKTFTIMDRMHMTSTVSVAARAL